MFGGRRFICHECVDAVEFDDQAKFFDHLTRRHDVDLDIMKIFNDDRFAITYSPRRQKKEKTWKRPPSLSPPLFDGCNAPPPPSLKALVNSSKIKESSDDRGLPNGSLSSHRAAHHPDKDYGRNRNHSPKPEKRRERKDDGAYDVSVGRSMVNELLREHPALPREQVPVSRTSVSPPGWDSPPPPPLQVGEALRGPKALKMHYPSMCAICLETSLRTREELSRHVRKYHADFLASCCKDSHASLDSVAESLWKDAPRCLICFEDFDSWDLVEKHWYKVHRSKPNPKPADGVLKEQLCPGCNLVRRDLNHFMFQHSLTCFICLARFWEKKELAEHMEIAHASWVKNRHISLEAFTVMWDEKEPVCSGSCGKKFKTWGSAQKHFESGKCKAKEDRDERKRVEKEGRREGREERRREKEDRKRKERRSRSKSRNRPRSEAKSRYRSRSRSRGARHHYQPKEETKKAFRNDIDIIVLE